MMVRKLQIIRISLIVLLVFIGYSTLTFSQSYKIADKYWDKAMSLEKQGKYADAAEMYVKSTEAEQKCKEPRLTDLSAELLRAGYCYDAIGQYNQALTFYGQALEIDRKLGDESSVSSCLNNIAIIYSAWGEYDKAIAYYEEALEIDQKLGNEDEIAIRLNNIGLVYYKWSKYNKAIAYYEEALEIFEKQEDEASSATLLNNIAAIFDVLGQYDKAIIYLEQSLKVAQKMGNESDIAIRLNNIASIYEAWGQYDKALKNYKKALKIFKNLGDEASTATLLNNIGSIYKSWAQYDKAMEYIDQALEIDRKLGKESSIAIRLNNIGNIYEEWGQYDSAIAYYEQAMEINLKLGNNEDFALNINNIASVYYSRRQYDYALAYFEQALEINQLLGKEDRIAIQLNNLGKIYTTWGQYDNAIEKYEQALEINQKLGIEDQEAILLGNIGDVYINSNQYEKAIVYFEWALEIVQKLGKEENISNILTGIGNAYYGWGRYDRAINYYEQAILKIEKIRLTADGDIRRDYLATQLSIYQILISAYIKNNQAEKAFETSELSSAKYLAEQIAGNKMPEQVDLSAYRKNILESTAVLNFANINIDISVRMVINSDNIFATEVNNSAFINAVTSNFSNQIQPQIIKGQVKFRGEGGLVADTSQTKNKKEFEAIINYYRNLLVSTNKTEQEKEAFKFLSQQLYTFLFTGIEEYIKDKTELVILPDGILGYLPFETLIMPDGRYLCEKYQIYYQQSLAVSNQIAQRETAESGVLALGGAVYNEKTYQSDMEITESEIAAVQKQAIYALNRGDNLTDIYDKLERGGWNNLPGTKMEAAAISLLNKNSKLITGKEANETHIKEMSQTGELKNFRILHFATHGTVVPAIPELSAVILSLDVDTINDGYLRMGEIAKLDIQAEFVNLSACETGLGRIYGGEGVVGLTQSWLIAGAKGLSVSLWKVDDIATKEFMITMYKKAFEENIPFKEAIYKTKMEFINETYGEQYKEPYYWAPFIYYGN